MNTWLNKKVKDTEIETVYQDNNLPILFDPDYYEYYTKYDLKSDDGFITGMISLDRYVEVYKEGKVFIPPSSNRYHCNYLYKKIINFTKKNKMYYPHDNGYVNLFDKKFKRRFYNFCYKYTHK